MEHKVQMSEEIALSVVADLSMMMKMEPTQLLIGGAPIAEVEHAVFNAEPAPLMVEPGKPGVMLVTGVRVTAQTEFEGSERAGVRVVIDGLSPVMDAPAPGEPLDVELRRYHATTAITRRALSSAADMSFDLAREVSEANNLAKFVRMWGGTGDEDDAGARKLLGDVLSSKTAGSVIVVIDRGLRKSRKSNRQVRDHALQGLDPRGIELANGLRLQDLLSDDLTIGMALLLCRRQLLAMVQS